MDEFSKIALPAERDSYINMLISFRDTAAEGVRDGDWRTLNILLEDIQEEISALRLAIKDRIKDNNYLTYKVVFSERLEIVSDIVGQLGSLDNVDSDVLKASIELKGELIDMIMNPEEVKLVRNTIDRIDKEAVRLIQYFDDKAQESKLDKNGGDND